MSSSEIYTAILCEFCSRDLINISTEIFTWATMFRMILLRGELRACSMKIFFLNVDELRYNYVDYITR